MHRVFRGVIISETWTREKCQRVERTVNGNTGPACPVISADSKDSVVSGASVSSLCQYKTSSLRPSLLTDAISHTGSKTTRLQSHHCCEGNCSSLSHKSAPPCALQAKTYICTYSQQHTGTHTDLLSLCQNQKSPMNLSLSCFFMSFSLCSWMLDLQ